MDQLFVPTTCIKTQCPEKYICMNKTCNLIGKKPYCYECLNKEHIGKNNVVQHLKEFIDLDKFMEQINIKIQEKNKILSQIIEECQNYQRDTLQQISQGSQLSDVNIKIQNIFKEKSEFSNILRNVMENNKQFTKYSLENHEQLKIIFNETNQVDLQVYMKRLQKLKVDIDNFLEDMHQVSTMSQKKITETIKKLEYQNNKNRFHSYILTFFIVALVLLNVKQQLDQPETSSNECVDLRMEVDTLRNQAQLNSDLFQNQFDALKLEQDKIQGKINKLQMQINSFNEEKKEKKNNNIQRLVGEIHQNLKINLLEDFTLIYDQHFTKGFSPQAREKLQKIAFKNQRNPVICIGGVAEKNLNEFILVGCDYATEIFKITTNTKVARKSENGDIYWYWVDKKSFGFSPTEKINLNASDREDLPNERRFSYWYNLGKDGGQRIGRFTSLLNSSNYRMRIYMFEE